MQERRLQERRLQELRLQERRLQERQREHLRELSPLARTKVAVLLWTWWTQKRVKLRGTMLSQQARSLMQETRQPMTRQPMTLQQAQWSPWHLRLHGPCALYADQLPHAMIGLSMR